MAIKIRCADCDGPIEVCSVDDGDDVIIRVHAWCGFCAISDAETNSRPLAAAEIARIERQMDEIRAENPLDSQP